jgi:HPt (histidine-containing phosphotransfer) domain-containing protein
MADIIGAMYSHLDPDKASEFAMDPEQLLNLAETFVSSLDNDLQALQAALGGQDMVALHRLLHTLKGYVTFLCKDDLGQQLIQLEAASRTLEFTQLKASLVALWPSLTGLHTEVIHWKTTVLQHRS